MNHALTKATQRRESYILKQAKGNAIYKLVSSVSYFVRDEMRCNVIFAKVSFLRFILSLTIFLGAGFFAYFIFAQTSILFANTVTIEAIVSGCGDGIIQSGENCDGLNLGGATCANQGFTSGTLSCNANCTFNTSQCVLAPPPPPPPGGGGGPAPLPIPETGATFSGKAFPNQSVTLLQGAKVVATTIAGSDARFSIRVTGLTVGTYIFSLYAEDHQGIRSSLVNFPLAITSGTIISVTGIFIAPSLEVNKAEVRRGDNIAIFGQTSPEADVTIQISGSPEFFIQTVSDKDGVYLYYYNTAPMDFGTYHAKSKAGLDGVAVSAFSRAVSFVVGARTVLKERPRVLRGDLNKDNRVSLVDFSIAAFWHRRPLSLAMRSIECEQLNCDGLINLVDFSIMAYYWTG